jgi:GNAT superfamily N-acetyltransferase
MIRRARHTDRDGLSAMMACSNGYDLPAARSMIQRFAQSWTYGPDNEVWVLESEGRALGFFQLLPLAPPNWELDLFFTANDAQGTGVGRKLFNEVRARGQALGATSVLIASNPQAAGFYRRQGARDIGQAAPKGDITWPRPLLSVDVPQRKRPLA